MARVTALSNGHLFLAHDARGTVRELCWPQVGYPNHLHGHWIRLGAWVNGHFWWCDGEGVSYSVKESSATLSYETQIELGDSGVSLTVTDWVHSSSDWWVRDVKVTNTSGHPAEVRLFQTHDLRLNETDISDTAFYHPFIRAIVHYKDTVACAFFVTGGGSGIDAYSCGIKNFNGLKGTWVDAEDGELSMKPIEQGTVDSTLATYLQVPSGGTKELSIICVFGSSVAAIERESDSVRSLGSIGGLRPPSVPNHRSEDALYKSSSRVINAHFALSRAGVGLVAASDSDIMTTNRANYGNVWLRDHSLACLTLIKCGQHHQIKLAIDFGLNALHADNCPLGRPKVFAQKYLPNGRLGPSWHPWVVNGAPEHPWQEDETALFVSLVAEAHREGLFVPNRSQWADLDLVFVALSSAIGSDDLPTESWDLWEERRGIHFFTVATVIDAFRDAAYLFDVRGYNKEANDYKLLAESVRRATLKHFVSPEGYIYRSLTREGGQLVPDSTVDSSVLAGLLRPCFCRETEMIKHTLARVISHLGVCQPKGGIGRYENDYYFRVSNSAPGNPWIISTLWVTQALINLGMTNHSHEFLAWVRAKATSTGMLAEQYNAETGEAVSVQPLAWSHSEYLETIHQLQLCGLGVG